MFAFFKLNTVDFIRIIFMLESFFLSSEAKKQAELDFYKIRHTIQEKG